MEYLDAFIVITSLAIDLSFLHGEKKVVGEKLLLVLTFRLWRFVRIISSKSEQARALIQSDPSHSGVGEGIRHGQTKHKARLNRQYLSAIRRLVELITHKTNYLEKNNSESLQAVLEHFRRIDSQCRSSEERVNRNRKLPSSAVVTQFLRELEEMENRSADSSGRSDRSFEAETNDVM